MPAVLAALVLAVAPQDAGCSGIDTARIVVATRPARQGGRVEVFVQSGPWGVNSLPPSCLTGWTASDPYVSFSEDHAQVLIGSQARPGALVTISAHAGDRTVEAGFRIVGASEPSLVGYWTQESADCGGATPAEPLRELRFDPMGGYSVTFVPFETRKDYWGPVAFDPASARIAFTVETTNMAMASVDLEGRARLDGEDRLLLDEVYFGGRDAAPTSGCHYVFARR